MTCERTDGGWQVQRAAPRAHRSELATGIVAGVVWQAAIWLTPLALGGGTDALTAGDTAALRRSVWMLVGLAVLQTAASPAVGGDAPA